MDSKDVCLQKGLDLSDSINKLKISIRDNNIDPKKGLGTELFLMTSSLTPIINVDLFVVDSRNRILLSWRDDQYCGTGWHIPGGCLRFKEKLEERIQKTAFSELGTEVSFEAPPMAVLENIANDYRTVVENDDIRAHFISLLYKCRVDDADKIINCDGKHVVGHLKWFEYLPEDFIDIQYYYRPIIKEWFDNISVF